MRCGKLRQRIRIERDLGGEPNSFGERPQNWQPLHHKLYADVRSPGGGESQRDEGTKGQTRYVVEIRYRADITADCRVIYRDTVLNVISAVDPEGWGERMLLECVAQLGVAS